MWSCPNGAPPPNGVNGYEMPAAGLYGSLLSPSHASGPKRGAGSPASPLKSLPIPTAPPFMWSVAYR